MNIDDRLRRAADDVRRSTAGATPPPLRRRRPLALAAGALAVVLAGSGVAAWLLRPADGVVAGSTSSTGATTVPTTIPSPGTPTTAVPSTSIPPSTTTTTDATTTTAWFQDLPVPVAGWERVFADDGTFGAVTITDAVAVEGKIVAAGCAAGDGDPASNPADPPIWLSDDGGTSWSRAAGDSPAIWWCLGEIRSTPFGLYAGRWDLLHSTDGGATWARVALDGIDVVDQILVADDTLVVIGSRASLNETREATILTTTDGITWVALPDGVGQVFDTSDINDVVAGGDGFIAVGASPGGQFVPTAAVWTSSDGQAWRVVTPAGEGYDDAEMKAVTPFGDGFVAVGYDYEATSLMAAWTSPDGITWARSPSPRGDEAAEFGFMGADALTVADGRLYAVGTDFDAGRDEESTQIPAIWSSVDGVTWIPDVSYDSTATVPFAIAGDVGFWPPFGFAGFGIENVVQVFSAVE
jgi:photosystem II stability/assembly factor-like uncharacterized protein